MSRTVPLLALAALLACARPQPSPEYEKARAIWHQLVQERGLDAASDPRSDEVLVLLGRVDAGSLDASEAATLRHAIEGDRRARAEELAHRQELVAKAAKPTPAPVLPQAAVEVAPPPAAPPPLKLGMKLEDFRASHGDCFAARGPVQYPAPDGGTPRMGDLWGLKDDAACREKYAPWVGQVALFSKGTLAGEYPVSSVKQVEVRRKIQVGKLPDGRMGERLPSGEVVPLPEGVKLEPIDGEVR
jgi:hypothetical protein